LHRSYAKFFWGLQVRLSAVSEKLKKILSTPSVMNTGEFPPEIPEEAQPLLKYANGENYAEFKYKDLIYDDMERQNILSVDDRITGLVDLDSIRTGDILGVVYDPMADECYWAEKNIGAYINGIKIKISKGVSMKSSVFLMEHGSFENDKINYLQCMKQLILDNGPAILRQGSTALMLCHVAMGRFEAFLSCGDELYDYAAGLIIAQEAGAIISDWSGEICDNSSSYLLASNVQLNKQIIKRITKFMS